MIRGALMLVEPDLDYGWLEAAVGWLEDYMEKQAAFEAFCQERDP